MCCRAASSRRSSADLLTNGTLFMRLPGPLYNSTTTISLGTNAATARQGPGGYDTGLGDCRCQTAFYSTSTTTLPLCGGPGPRRSGAHGDRRTGSDTPDCPQRTIM